MGWNHQLEYYDVIHLKNWKSRCLIVTWYFFIFSPFFNDPIFACFTQKNQEDGRCFFLFTPASRQVMFETFGESQLILVFACLLACLFLCLFVWWLDGCFLLVVSFWKVVIISKKVQFQTSFFFSGRNEFSISQEVSMVYNWQDFVWIDIFETFCYLWGHFTRLYLGKLILNFDIFMFNTRHPYLLSCSLWFLFRCAWWVQSYRTPVFGCLGPKM